MTFVYVVQCRLANNVFAVAAITDEKQAHELRDRMVRNAEATMTRQLSLPESLRGYRPEFTVDTVPLFDTEREFAEQMAAREPVRGIVLDGTFGKGRGGNDGG